MKHDLHLTAAYIPGVLNKVSDYESRNFKSQDKEWMLNPKLLTKAFETLKFTPEIDLFASRLNKQLPQYCAYRPDPDAKFIDAFSISWSHIKFYCFPPFSCILRAVRKIIQDQALGILVIPNWPTPTLVSYVNATSESTLGYSAPINRSSQAQVISGNCSPSPQEAGTTYLSCIREKLSQQGLSQDAVTIILASWRDGTKSQYQTHLLKWFAYCKDKRCNILSPPVAVALDFLATLFHSGLSYSSINTARSALSSILQVNNNSLPFGQLPIVQRFMKGIYELRPSFPKYTSVWDLKIVLNYFRSQPSASDLTL